MNHGIVIIGDMDLVAMILGPELGPSAIVVLSAEDEEHALTEGVTVALMPRLSVQACQELHLRRRGVVVYRRVVAAALLLSDAVLPGWCQGCCHVRILRPSARVALVEQQMVAYPAGFCRAEERRVPLLQSPIGVLSIGRQCRQCQ